ncbi:hypothetical protein SynA18461_02213 [Synechococcus sp. A18-46.1]|nr:hypothetical protein SynA18461_02213 [Synechococcus sp. A18-46.1]
MSRQFRKSWQRRQSCSASSLSAHIQNCVDGRQRNQTGEAKILVIHVGYLE